MQAETIGRAFMEAAEVDGLAVSFWNDPGRSTDYEYSTLLENALAVAAALEARGVKQGDAVAIVLTTGPDFYAAFFGVSLVGAIPTALYPPARLGRVDEWKTRTAQMLIAVNAVMVLTERRLVPLLGSPVRTAAPRYGCATTQGLQLEGQGRRLLNPGQTDLAAIQFSSGSTGDPKPVALSHENMLSNARTILASLPVPAEERSGVSWLPLYHDMGLVGCLLSAVVSKAPLTLMGPEQFVTKPLRWLQALSETKATISVAPNFAFGLTAKKVSDEDVAALDLSQWKVALCGAEPVHPRTLDVFSERFAPAGFDRRAITPVYGLAEATLAVTFSDPSELPKWQCFDPEHLENGGRATVVQKGRKLSSLGRPLSGCEVEIRDEDGKALVDGMVGTVHARSPGVMVGYLHRDEVTRRTIDEAGWLDTGDTGFLHDGELYLCGRSKDLVIINGRNHDPAVVEQALDGVDGIRPGCIVAFATAEDESDTESLVVLAERATDDETPAEKVEVAARAAIQRQTGLRLSVFELLEPGTLPRTSSGKLRRNEARKRWCQSALSTGKRATAAFVLREMAAGFYHHLCFRAGQLGAAARLR